MHGPARFRLVACDADGCPVQPLPPLPPELAAHCRQTADWLAGVGFQPPFVGYVAVAGDAAVGGGAFVRPPRDGSVEIAYFTLPAFERRGHGARTARALVGIAQAAGLAVHAYTLMEENASTRILRGLGFAIAGTAEDDDAGTVWHWRLPAPERSA